jgi:DNA mismatch repair protein MutS
MTLYDEYIAYTQEYKDKYGERTVVLIEVGSFWELYCCDKGLGANMREICNLLNITISRKNKNIVDISSTNPQMAGFPSHALGKFLPLLINDDWTVVLVGQTTPPPNPKRDVVNVISKGTYISDQDAFRDHNNYIMCLVGDQCLHPFSKSVIHMIGIACVDITTGKVEINELAGHDISVLADELYQLYSNFRPNEILLYKAHNSFEFSHFDKLLGKVNQKIIKDFTVHGIDDNISKVAFQEFILNKAFGSSNKSMLTIHESLNIEKYLAASAALTALLRYIFDHDTTLLRNLSLPVLACVDNNLYLDLYYNCAEQLDLYPLIERLNKCVTPIGKRYFRQRLTRPYINKDYIQTALNDTELFLDKYDTVRTSLTNITDVERMFRKITIGKCHPHELGSLVISLLNVCRLTNIIQNENVMKATGLIIDYIETNVDIDLFSQCGLDVIDPFIFKQGKDVDFDSLLIQRSTAIETYEKLAVTYSSIIEVNNAFKLERNDRDGMFFLVTQKRYDLLKSKKIDCPVFNSLQIQGTNTTHIKLANQTMKNIDNDIFNYDEKLQSLCKSKWCTFLDNINMAFASQIYSIIDYIAYCDFYSCAALIAKENNYSKPCLSKHDKAGLKALKMRHPLVELVNKKYTYVPNDIDLFSKKSWLLYGLNAAGKSTLMKMVALNCIMAQSGLFVPCESMEFVPYNAIYTRITKGDDIMDGKSTFVVEMSELRNILLRANTTSLVIGDEICCSSEVLSAISIVHTGISELLDKDVSFIFATHLHVLNDSRVRICHLHVEFDGNGLKYNRILQDGEGPKTYGIEVCRYLNMPGDFVTKALQMRQYLQNGKLDSTPLTSKYNKDIMYDPVCSICNKACTRVEVHHIKHQVTFEKEERSAMNALNNLVILCDLCHEQVHKGTFHIQGKILTSEGIQPQTDKKETTLDQSRANENGADTLETFVMQLHKREHLSYPKMIDKIYKEKGISISTYRLRKILQQKN